MTSTETTITSKTAREMFTPMLKRLIEAGMSVSEAKRKVRAAMIAMEMDPALMRAVQDVELC